MTQGGDANDEADSFLRAVASAPERVPEAMPTRVAHFRIVGRLGQGGMGVVYRAEDEKLRRAVAIKVLPDTSGNEERRQRFLREARSAAAITHPNVAVVHAVDEGDGRIYIAMELVEGENLRARLERGRLDLSTTKDIAAQIARGLAAAHEKGIVHRDLKPENVMITPAGVVKLLDFGLAKVGADERASPNEAALAKTETVVTSDEGRIMGTPAYMSPEQAMGEPLGVRSDVFSFGIVLYEMLTGTGPFIRPNNAAVLVAIARDPAPPLRERMPTLDPRLEALVARCLAKNPADRFADASEIVAALGEPAPHEEITSSHPGPTLPERSGSHRASPVAWISIAGALLALAFAALFLAPSARQTPLPALAAQATRGCKSNAECGSSSAAVCRRGQCVALATSECRVLAAAADVGNDATVWFGVMFPLTGQPAQAFGQAHLNAVDLARREFARVSGGIVGKDGKSRPLGVLACDDSTDPERAARHLAEDLHVPAVIGFYKSDEVVELAREFFIPNRVLFIAANNRSPLVTAVPEPAGQPRLAWRTGASSSQYAAAVSAVVEGPMTDALRRESAVGAQQRPRVALVRGSTPTSLAFGEAIAVRQLQPVANALPEGFVQVVLDDGSPDVASGVAQILATRPQIIIDEFDTMGDIDVLRAVEKAWPVGVPRPRYLMADAIGDGLARWVAESAGNARRVLGVDVDTGTSAIVRFALRYNEFFTPQVTPATALGNAYDAFYALAYAATASKDPQSADNLAEQFSRFGSGRSIEVGAMGIFDASNALRAGEPIALEGTGSHLKFDPNTGEPQFDFSIVCFRRVGNAATVVPSGLRYRAEAEKVEGSLDCP